MIDISIEEINRRLQKTKIAPVDIVVGIAHGGTIPAAMVSKKTEYDLRLVHFNYRDENNNPRHVEPVLLKAFNMPKNIKSVLLVDDVSVSGKTLNAARRLFKDYNIKTFVFKGAGDYVLFPEVDECVNWPWKSPAEKKTRIKWAHSKGENDRS